MLISPKHYLLIAFLGAPLLVACASGGAPPASEAVESKYLLVMDRSYPAGRDHRIKIVKSETSTTTYHLGDQEAGKEVKETVLTFTGTRLAGSSAESGPRSYRASRITREEEGEVVDIVEPGSEILSSLDGEERVYVVNGEPLAEDAQKALRKLLGKGPSNHKADDDDIFGSKTKRAVGESWLINAQAAAEADESLKLKAKDIQGGTRLVSVHEVDGIEVLEIEAHLEVAVFQVPELPEGAKMTQSKVSASFLGQFPVDVSLPALSRGMTMNIEMTMEIPTKDGKVMTAHVVSQSFDHENWYPE